MHFHHDGVERSVFQFSRCYTDAERLGGLCPCLCQSIQWLLFRWRMRQNDRDYMALVVLQHGLGLVALSLQREDSPK